jgi:two-component system sensor histidine kinase KdpD
MIYLLVIMVVAVFLGRGPSILASALSVAAYDFFFVTPYYTFAVHDQRHVLTFVVMFLVGVLISGLTLRIRRQEREARAREERTATLYKLSRDLGSAVDEEQATEVTAQHAAEVFEGGAAVLAPSVGDGKSGLQPPLASSSRETPAAAARRSHSASPPSPSRSPSWSQRRRRHIRRNQGSSLLARINASFTGMRVW